MRRTFVIPNAFANSEIFTKQGKFSDGIAIIEKVEHMFQKSNKYIFVGEGFMFLINLGIIHWRLCN